MNRGHLLRAFPALFRVGLAEMVAYRAEMVIWFLTASLPLVMMLVWDRVAQGGPVAGFSQDDFARYFAATLVVRQFTSAWVVWELNHEIRTGRLSTALLKPLNPLLINAVGSLAVMPYRLLVLLPVVALIGWWRPGVMAMPGPLELALLPVAVLSAWALNFLAQVVIGCLAFFLEQSLGFWDVFFGLFAVLSGYLFPLAVLPDWGSALAHGLPFQAMLAIPVEIASGARTGWDAVGGVGLQVAWVAVFYALARLTWSRGIRRYEAYGA